MPLTQFNEFLLRKSLQRYASEIGTDTIRQAAEKLLSGLRSILEPRRTGVPPVTEGKTPTQVRAEVNALLERAGGTELVAELNIDFKIDVATKVARGAKRFAIQNEDAVRVEEWPALEFHRIYERDVPRGFRRTGKGLLVAEPDDAWPARWEAAGASAGDSDWLPWDDALERGVALKSSGIWDALGDGAGGYDDTLGNPFPPFAFNSGYGTDEVSREDAIELGLNVANAVPQELPADFFAT